MLMNGKSEPGVVVVAKSCLDSMQPHGLQHATLMLCFAVSQSLLRFMSFESVMLSSHLILCLPILLWPSVFPSIRVFSSESALLIRWPVDWSFRISNGVPSLIHSFENYWLSASNVLGPVQRAGVKWSPLSRGTHDKQILGNMAVTVRGHDTRLPQGYLI